MGPLGSFHRLARWDLSTVFGHVFVHCESKRRRKEKGALHERVAGALLASAALLSSAPRHTASGGVVRSICGISGIPLLTLL